MIGRRFAMRWASAGVALVSLAVLPACQGGGFPLRRGREAYRPTVPEVVPYSAYRPAYSPGPPRKTLFLGGYAGYPYGPARPTGYVPTKHGVQVWSTPVGHHDPAGRR